MCAPAGQRWTPLWTLLTVLMFVGEVRARYMKICYIQCCTLAPHCDNATTVNCVCPKASRFDIRQDLLPPTVESIQISHMDTLTINRLAVYNLLRLRDITVRDVQNVFVADDGLAQQRPSNLVSVRLERVRLLDLHRDALSGLWRDDAEVTLSRIALLDLSAQALHFTAGQFGPRLMMEHVARLEAASGAVTAVIGQLALVNVTMAQCQSETFSGGVRVLELLGSRVERVQSRCVRADHRWHRLAIRSTHIGDVGSLGFTGQLESLYIEASEVGRLRTHAFHLNVSDLEIKRSAIDEVDFGAVDIQANNSIIIMESSVERLRKGALSRLRLTDSPRTEMKPFTIHSFTVKWVENGSLSMALDNNADDLNWDSLLFSRLCTCTMSSWVRQLVVGGDIAHITEQQRRVIDIVYHNGYCFTETRRQVTIASNDVRCGAGGDSMVNPGGDGMSTVDQNIVFYAVIAGAVLVVTLLTTVCVVKRRKICAVLIGEEPARGGSQPARSVAPLLDSTAERYSGRTTRSVSRHTSKTDLNSAGLPDLVHMAPYPGTVATERRPDLPSPPITSQEHIYAEIRSPVQPAPPPLQISEYSQPHDSVGPLAPAGEPVVYAEITEVAPLVEGTERPCSPPLPPGRPTTDSMVSNQLYSASRTRGETSPSPTTTEL